MSESSIKTKYFSEGEIVSWELSPYHKGIGAIRGQVEGMPGLDDDWWIVELGEPEDIAHYDYSCIVVPGYRREKASVVESLVGEEGSNRETILERIPSRPPDSSQQ